MDQAVGRLQAALASVTNEVTVAAANIKFDFSIVKYEAPKEFQPVGQLLSDRRKRDAEDGKSHITARRLAALFAGVCPKTPALVASYGKRASEIATQATSKVSKAHFASVFSQYTGVDATSMWAAATSSPNGADGDAIQVHLLACMLASVWDAPEATSIWVEIVEGRRHEIVVEVDGGGAVPFATAAAAAQAEIPRQQLAEWDASARAWLEVANSVKSKEQTQFRLILENIELSVGGGERCLTTNVIGAWVRAVTVMDNLLSGIPQEVSDGSAIVGLTAWHLYPEIHVFSRRNVEVKMNDDLVPPGGILTLGCSPSATTPSSGVTWALSLSKLRYYGKSVPATTTLRADSSRLTADEFRFALVGCLLRTWNTPPADDQKVIHVLGDIARNVVQDLLALSRGGEAVQRGVGYERIRTWIAAMLLLHKTSEDYAGNEDEFRPFITLGRNRPKYGPMPRAHYKKMTVTRPFFGILDSSTFLSALLGPEERIAALRRIAPRFSGLQDGPAIIRYTLADHHHFGLIPLFPSLGGGDAEPDLPRRRGFSGNNLEPFVTAGGKTFRPLFGDITAAIFVPSGPFYDIDVTEFSLEDLTWALQHRIIRLDIFTLPDDPMAPWLAPFHHALSCLQLFPEPIISVRTLLKNPQDAKWATDWIQAFRETFPPQDQGLVPGWDQVNLPPSDREIVATGGWVTLPPWNQIKPMTVPALDQLASAPLVSRLAGNAHMGENSESSRNFDWFVYCSRLVSDPWTVPVKEAFSILAYFISGYDIGHNELDDNTAGISFGSSLYVPNELLRDPFATRADESRSITRILGNIGRPGLVIFSSVKDPMTASLDDTAWRVVEDMGSFDGQPTDLFASTSMHLSFTQWGRSMDLADSQGNQDVHLTKMESVVSVRDAGRWIGDVDVVAALKSPHIHAWSPKQSPCGHATVSEPPQWASLKSISNWDQLRECQSGLAVVRVHGNWLARLAVTAYLAQRAEQAAGAGAKIMLLPSSVCWTCLMNDNESHSIVYIY
ncbi:hypothetical protein B0J18DRAFT_441260 [Chaetomium sp. MPI-SDFR-AT-0129]|nr:hypothetical protein B0J18DRAFT_441260 [Chaetomium sp. MPI-SDFR-AT-0129]